MELIKVEKLLEKYFEAQTTVNEEKELHAYFSSNNVAQHLEQYKSLFNYFSNAKEETLSNTIPLKPKKKINFKWLNVAAVTLLAGYFGYNYYQDYRKEKLYQETKDALILVSKNFNSGTKNLVHFSEIENTKNRIFK